MSVDDDLAARALMRATEDLPAYSVITRAWAEDTLRTMRRVHGILTEAERKRRDELAWLRASLEADILPDWCIQLVLANW